MVVRKAWLPGCGTYSVEPTSEVYNPTQGQVEFIASQPKDIATTLEKPCAAESIDPLKEAGLKPSLEWYLNIASLANLATVEPSDDSSHNSGDWKVKGAPTEIAIEVFAGRFGWNRLQLSQGPEAQWKHVAEFPFDSDVKKMTVLFENVASRETHVFTKVLSPNFAVVTQLLTTL